MLKLFQLEESPENTKDMHILRYILNKLGVENSYIPFISGDENALYHLGFSCYKLASRNWLDNAERKELLKQLLQIGQQLFQETGSERYQQFIDVAKEQLASL